MDTGSPGGVVSVQTPFLYELFQVLQVVWNINIERSCHIFSWTNDRRKSVSIKIWSLFTVSSNKSHPLIPVWTSVRNVFRFGVFHPPDPPDVPCVTSYKGYPPCLDFYLRTVTGVSKLTTVWSEGQRPLVSTRVDVNRQGEW